MATYDAESDLGTTQVTVDPRLVSYTQGDVRPASA